ARNLVQVTRLQFFTEDRQILHNQVRCYLAKKAATRVQTKRARSGSWAFAEKRTFNLHAITARLKA
ncbi:hypothetical protein AB4142_35265, partial [Variovorax sp. 2RAF20]